LLGQAVIFPTILLSDALVYGITTKSEHRHPDASWLNLNNLALARVVVVAGIGRSFGPALVRGSIFLGGQNSYALQQLVAAGSFILLFEVLFVPFAKTHSGMPPLVAFAK
jgi:hypothetical protein